MPECPVCLGDGGQDLRNDRALLEEFLPPIALAEIPNLHLDWIECDECEGTGIVSLERELEIAAWARASVDQFVARMKDEGRLT
jgi:hypothetical protein